MWTFHCKNSSKYTPKYLAVFVLLIEEQMQLFSSLLHGTVCYNYLSKFKLLLLLIVLKSIKLDLIKLSYKDLLSSQFLIKLIPVLVSCLRVVSNKINSVISKTQFFTYILVKPLIYTIKISGPSTFP